MGKGTRATPIDCIISRPTWVDLGALAECPAPRPPSLFFIKEEPGRRSSHLSIHISPRSQLKLQGQLMQLPSSLRIPRAKTPVCAHLQRTTRHQAQSRVDPKPTPPPFLPGLVPLGPGHTSLVPAVWYREHSAPSWLASVALGKTPRDYRQSGVGGGWGRLDPPQRDMPDGLRSGRPESLE